MAGAAAQGAHGGIDDVGTGLDALQQGHGSQTGGVVAVDIDRDGQGVLQLLDQVVAGVRSQQASHILDADGVCAHLFQGLGILDVVLVVVHGAQGVADAALHMCLFLVGCLDGGLQVAGVVQCVEDADDVDAVGNRLLHEVLDGVICIGAVAQHVLAAEQHLQLLVGQLLAQDAQTFPGVLVEEADAAIEGSAAPALDREIRDLIHFGQDGTHVVHRHTGGQQRLVRIAQDDFRDLDRLFGHGCHLSLRSQFMETRTSPELTVSPLLTLTEATVPSCGATISFSIFMASRMTSTSPALTDAPAATLTSRMLPGMGALTATAPAAPAGAAALGAAAGAAGALGAAGAAGAATGAAPAAVSSTETL